MRRSLALLLFLPGCLIEEVPRYDDELGVVGGAAPALRSIAVGYQAACGVLDDGAVQCWGANRNDQLGTGDPAPSYRPTVMGHFDDVEQLAMASQSCAIRAGGQVWCWGVEMAGGMPAPPAEVTLPGAAQAITLYSNGNMVLLADGTVALWGSFPEDYQQHPTPVVKDGLDGVTAIARGDVTACAVHSGGLVSCWGHNEHGQLGIGTITPENMLIEVPTEVVGVTTATSVVTGSDGCALLADESVVCWGGQSFQPAQPTPQAIPELVGVKQLVGGGSFTCALYGDGTVACFGNGYEGSMIPDGAGTRPTPITIDGLPAVAEIATGNEAMCARAMDDRVFCWGNIFPGNGSTEWAGAIPTEVLW